MDKLNPCFTCKKKKMMNLLCKCNHYFCMRHLHNHNCSFNYREDAKSRIYRENPIITPTKLPTI